MNLGDQLKSWLGEHFVYDFAERARLLRGVTAKGHGMDPAEFSKPFPGTNNMTTIQVAGLGGESPPPAAPVVVPPVVVTQPSAPAACAPAGLSSLAKLGMAAAVLVGTGGGALGLASLLRPQTVPSINLPATTQRIEDLYDLQIKRPGGDWETVPRLPK